MKWFFVVTIAYLALILYLALNGSFMLVAISIFNVITLAAIYKELKNVDVLKRIEKKIEGINIDKISGKIDLLRDDQTRAMLKAFEVEMDLAKYKEEQEERYREVVKKVLELDNKLNEKYELLGKSIIKLSKDIKKS